MAVGLLGCASTAKQEGTEEYVDDSSITAKMQAEIFKEDSLESNEINVETFKVVVQLSGFVNSQADHPNRLLPNRTSGQQPWLVERLENKYR